LAGHAAQARKPTSTLGKIARGADDFVRGVADTVTFGFADEIAAGADSLIKGTDYRSELEAQRLRDEEAGVSRTVGQIGGAFLPGTALVKGGQQALTKSQAATRAVGTGAAYGAAYGAGSSEATDIGDIASDATAGALMGAAGAKAIDTAGRALKWIAGRPALSKLADPETIKKQAAQLYDEADSLGVSVKPKALQAGVNNIVSNLAKDGITPKSPVQAHRQVFEIVDYFKQAASGKANLTWRDLENLRRSAADVSRTSTDPTVRKYVGQVVDDFEDLIGNLQPQAFSSAAGPAKTAEALRLTRDARQMWKQSSKAELLAEIGR
jgi:hypothetical protein